jgi:hypothetical protein
VNEVTDPGSGLVVDPATLSPEQQRGLLERLRARNRELEARIYGRHAIVWHGQSWTRPPGGGARERARRLRQIAAGQLAAQVVRQ